MKVQVQVVANGSIRSMPQALADALKKKGLVRDVPEASEAPVYQTRMMQAAEPAPARARASAKPGAKEDAPYGYKADGTPRKRPAPRAKSGG